MRTLLLGLLTMSVFSTYAQQNINGSNVSGVGNDEENEYKKNAIKINVLPLFIKTFAGSFEHLIKKRTSIQIGYRYQPYHYLADNTVGKFLAKKGIGNLNFYGFKVSNHAITPEIKFYLRQKDPFKGSYIGIYCRYNHTDFDDVNYIFISDIDVIYDVPLIGNAITYAGGISFGRQWLIKDRVSISYGSGIQYGFVKGTLISKKDLSDLTDLEKIELRQNIENMFAVNDKTFIPTEVTGSGVSGKISRGTFGVRSEISVGIIF